MQILCLDSILANDVDIVSSTSTMVVEEYEENTILSQKNISILHIFGYR